MKRLTAFLLVCCLLVSAVPAFAAGTEEVTRTLKVLDVMVGDETGNMHLDRAVTRAEFAKLLIAASTEADSLSGEGAGYSLFTDVKSTHWASEYIKLCLDKGWMIGYTDGSFRPGNTVVLEEACTAVLRLLGYDSGNLSGSFPTAQLSKAASVGLRDNLTAQRGDKLTRGDCARLFYNLLTCKTAQGQVYASTLGKPLDADGRVDWLKLVKEDLSDPFLWRSDSALGFTPAAVYLNDRQVDSYTPDQGDVCYTNSSQGVLWVYTDRVFGQISALTPTAGRPESVNVGGKNYTLSTDAVKAKLSALGEDAVVTLYLGLDGAVAEAEAVNGPFLWTSSSALGFTPTTVYLNDRQVDGYTPAVGDVCYTNAAQGVLRVYTDRVFGQISALTPSIGRPEAVNVGGKSYTLATDAVKAKLSALGDNAVGTVVTLYLGLDGAVAEAETVNGPFVAAGFEKLAFTPKTVYRNGVLADSATLNANDVYYYSAETQILWVYADKISGRVEGLTPSAMSPTAVTVAGKSYTLGSETLRRELSALNGKWTDKFVTLLLGMDGSVVRVLSGDSVAADYYGVVRSAVKEAVSGSVEQRLTVLCTDGVEHTFPVRPDDEWEAGDLVRVAVTGSGAEVSAMPAASLSGTVRGGKIGGTHVAGDVQILDVAADGTAVKVESSALEGLTFTADSVRCYTLNGDEAVDRLILKDATGELWSYAFLADVTKQSTGGLGSTGRYTLVMDGQTRTVQVSGKSFPVTKANGVAVRLGSDGSVAGMQSLKPVTVTSVNGQTAYAGNRSYPIAADAQVCLKDQNGDCYPAQLADVAKNFTLTAWYDPWQKEIRVILAQ